MRYCGRSMVFYGHYGFQLKKKTVENGVNHHNIEINLIFIHNKHQPSSQCFNTDMIEYYSSEIY